MVDVVYLGRQVKMYKGATAVAWAKSINVKVSKELIKEYSMDATTPAITGGGKQTNTWSIEKLFDTTVSGQLLDDLKAGTKFTLIFAVTGSSTVAPFKTLGNCTILNWDRDADPPTLHGGDPKASGLVLLKNDILDLQKLKICPLPLQKNPNWHLNPKQPIQEDEYAFRPTERKTHKAKHSKGEN